MKTLQRELKPALLMMQKDEYLRLDAWIRYYSSLFGSSSLFLFDNGSTRQSVRERLKEAADSGCRVYWQYNRPEHYYQRENIFTEFIQNLDATDPHDFYLPLDCDEFIAVLHNGNVSLEKEQITAELAQYIESPDILKIHHKLWHNPYHINQYAHNTTSEKCFFAKHACAFLAPGFHKARAKKSDKTTTTNIIYFEFHYQPYKAHMQNSRDKLAAYTTHFSRPALKRYIKGRGYCFHCAVDMLKSEYEYARELLYADNLIPVPELLQRFDQLGIAYQQLYAKSSPLGGRWRLTSLRLKHFGQRASDPLIGLSERLRASLRRRAKTMRQRMLG
jgi:hypothetical protein